MGVLCAGGWLLWPLPLPPPGVGNFGRRSTVPVGATTVGGLEEKLSLKKDFPKNALLASDTNTTLASTTMTIAIINTL